jgi:diadenylate cyclase
MDGFRNELENIVDRIDPIDVLDVVLIAAIIYGAFLLVRGTAAMALLRGAALILVGIVIIARVFNLEVLDFLIRNSLTGLIIAVPIIFQPEIRRALERVGRTGFRVWTQPSRPDDLIETITKTAMQLAVQRHGALIVFERETGLENYVETGVGINGEPSAELLGGIFFPNSPLHDGAVILRDGKVIAAGCTLPLSETRLPGEMGLRHRAGLGVTEGTDAISVMVSEESGMVAVATDGRMYTRLDETRLNKLLGDLFSANGHSQDSVV